jgi:hypothetical protein
METEYKNNIYSRLLEIKFNIDISTTPTPQQINEKIGECHAYIEEVEHFSIRVHQELSIIQQALNNAQAQYELKKDTLITQEPIRSLPNIKDREAQSNLSLKEDREIIKNYQNELNDLNNLLKAINLKQKNLTRANADIKLQMRVIDAQIKLGPSSATNAAAKSLMEEMHKSNIGTDSFEEALSEATEETIVDPSTSIDTTNLFMDSESEINGLSNKLIDPVTNLNNPEGEEPLTEEWPIDNENIINIEKNITENKEPEIDLDETIDLDKKGGENNIEEQQKKETTQKENVEETEIDGIDLDDLLSEYS